MLPNQRAMSAVEEAASIWGRKTLFDEYSKTLAICTKARGKDDLAFVTEYLALHMKTSTGPKECPDSPSRVSLKSKTGLVSQAQFTKDALAWLSKTYSKEWVDSSSFANIILTPAGFDLHFPVLAHAGATAVKRAEELVSKTLLGAVGPFRTVVLIVKKIFKRDYDFSKAMNGCLS